ncbi:MAG: creatininase family protein [Acetobacteraceae bacterium]|nr:creatininase family protein [Acetobacteraceae bacterium]
MTSVLWAEHSAPELREAAARGAIVILPVAALEQHGPHLSTMVDFRLCGEVAKRGAELATARGSEVLVLPPVWSGMSDHHLPFGGTVSLPFDAFRAVILGIAGSVRASGFARLFVLNGHGGNVAALSVILQEAATIEGLRSAGATYWLLAESEARAILEDQPGVRHACEAETSMMLAVEPGQVRRERLAEAFGGAPATVSAGTPDPVIVWRDFAERSTSGVIGDARRASAGKGERLLAACSAALCAALCSPATWTKQAP